MTADTAELLRTLYVPLVAAGYKPADITASPSDPVAVWEQFCAEARITHNGSMKPPPRETEQLSLL